MTRQPTSVPPTYRLLHIWRTNNHWFFRFWINERLNIT